MDFSSTRSVSGESIESEYLLFRYENSSQSTADQLLA